MKHSDRPSWWRIAVVAVIFVPLAYFAGTHVVAVLTRTSEPERALALVGNDAVALMRQAQSGIGKDGKVDQVTVTSFAKRSVEAQGLNPRAIEALGAAAASRGDVPAAKRLFALSNAQSRRNLSTQLWLIEEAVQANDVPRAFTHYNAALRTRNASQDLLFPVLTVALEDERLWPAFLPYIDPSNRWLGAFFRYAFRQSANPEAFARLLASARTIPASTEMEALQGELLRRLISRGSIADARRLYLRLPGAAAPVFASPALSAASADPRYVPITWMLFQRDGVGAYFQRDGAENQTALAFSIDRGTPGTLARKLLVVPAGVYRFSTRQHIETPAPDVTLTWSLLCLRGEKAEPLQRSSSNLGQTRRMVDVTVSISRACSAILLDLAMASGGEEVTVDFTIDHVTLTPLGD
ncbi:hypothetical protein [Sphingomonas sp. LT1P40]|uniref:hypothetical protein n=1 Tax=Alteristakelama amylovorans TaxID=3096166 RepID=UPI002FC7DA71